MQAKFFSKLAIGMMVVAQIFISCSKDNPQPEPTPEPEPTPNPQPEVGKYGEVINKDAAQHGYIVLKKEKGKGDWNFGLLCPDQDKANVWIDFNNNGYKDPEDMNVKLDGKYNNYNIQSPVITIYGKITQLSCSRNNITVLDASRSISLTELFCTENNFDKATIINVITSLPETNGKFFGWEEESKENNYKSSALLELFQQKGWTPHHLVDGKWIKLAFNQVSKYGEVLNKEFAQRGYMILKGGGNKNSEWEIKVGDGLLWIDFNNNGVQEQSEEDAVYYKRSVKVESEVIVIYGRPTSLICNANTLTVLDVTQNTALEELRCENNKLTSLDVTQNTALKELKCNNNQLTSLDVRQNTELKWFHCNDNQLTSLDVTKNSSLFDLKCNNNQLTSLDVRQNTELMWFYCNDNQLTSLDVTQNKALRRLKCNNNQLTSLDVTKKGELSYLNCSNNQLTSLDVTQNTALDKLDCSNNKLTSLEVTKNYYLSRLDCNNNQLTTLRIGYISLYTVNCYQNKLSEEAMNHVIYRLRYRINGKFYGWFPPGEENNYKDDELKRELRDKGWKPYYFDGNRWVEWL